MRGEVNLNISTRYVRTIQVSETCRQFPVFGQEVSFSVGVGFAGGSLLLSFHHDVARGAFHPPASKARPALGGEGLLRRPSVGISVRDLYRRRDISLQDVVLYF